MSLNALSDALWWKPTAMSSKELTSQLTGAVSYVSAAKSTMQSHYSNMQNFVPYLSNKRKSRYQKHQGENAMKIQSKNIYSSTSFLYLLKTTCGAHVTWLFRVCTEHKLTSRLVTLLQGCLCPAQCCLHICQAANNLCSWLYTRTTGAPSMRSG